MGGDTSPCGQSPDGRDSHTLSIQNTSSRGSLCCAHAMPVLYLLPSPVLRVSHACALALTQAASGIPLTVYGTGGQTRAFIHISDTCRCVELAVANPPKAGERVEILNQVAETARVRDIAQMVAKLFDAEVQQVENPRQEDAENELVVANQKFKLLGLDPVLLESADGLFKEVTEIAEKYLHRIDKSKVASIAYWNKKRADAVESGAGTALGK